MSKYRALHDHLAGSRLSEVAMTFSDIERLLGAPLPNSANQHRAWWSNNTFNNVMTKAWLAAGFRTERVDMAERRLVFRRVAGGAFGRAEPPVSPRAGGRHPLFGCLKGSIRVAADTDLTAPADPDWSAPGS